MPRVSVSAAFDPLAFGASAAVSFALRVNPQAGLDPTPLAAIEVEYPRDLGLATSGLGTANCEPSRLQAFGEGVCPANSRMGSGSAIAVLPFGPGLVREQVTLGVFAAPSTDGYLPPSGARSRARTGRRIGGAFGSASTGKIANHPPPDHEPARDTERVDREHDRDTRGRPDLLRTSRLAPTSLPPARGRPSLQLPTWRVAGECGCPVPKWGSRAGANEGPLSPRTGLASSWRELLADLLGSQVGEHQDSRQRGADIPERQGRLID